MDTSTPGTSDDTCPVSAEPSALQPARSSSGRIPNSLSTVDLAQRAVTHRTAARCVAPQPLPVRFAHHMPHPPRSDLRSLVFQQSQTVPKPPSPAGRMSRGHQGIPWPSDHRACSGRSATDEMTSLPPPDMHRVGDSMSVIVVVSALRRSRARHRGDSRTWRAVPGHLRNSARPPRLGRRSTERAKPLASARFPPCPDGRPKPESRPPRTALDDWAGEIVVAAKVGGHAVAVAEAKDVGDLLGVDKIFGVDNRGHGDQST